MGSNCTRGLYKEYGELLHQNEMLKDEGKLLKQEEALRKNMNRMEFQSGRNGTGAKGRDRPRIRCRQLVLRKMRMDYTDATFANSF